MTWRAEVQEWGRGKTYDWGTGVGVLSVYVDDMHRPALVIPLNLCATSQTFNAFALTGDERYRTHTLEYLDAW